MTAAIYPPGPKSSLPFGYSNIIKLARNPLTFIQELAQYGDMAHYKFRGRDVFLLNHPDYVRDVLVTHQRKFSKGNTVTWLKHMVGEGLLTSAGDFHLRQRRLSQPAFHKKRISAYADVMTEYSLRQQASWQNGQILNVHQEMMLLTLAIVVKALFDTDIDNMPNLSKDKLIQTFDILRKWSQRVALPVEISEFLEKMPLPSTQRPHKAMEYLDGIIYGLIEERRAIGEDRGDLLSMLIQAQDEEGSHERMTNAQVRDESITFFLAGHDTTALTLTWMWYLLSQHPEVEAKLHTEVDMVLAGRQATMEDIPRLPYTEQIMSEALRMYPPAYVFNRVCEIEHKFGDYIVPAGSLLFISPYLMHHHPRYFPEPDKFKPERWTPEFKAQLPKFAYFPFGGGTRLCIGEPFAWMEGILVLATLAQNWQMRLAAGQVVKTRPLITLSPQGGMPMLLERRKNAVKPPEVVETQMKA